MLHHFAHVSPPPFCMLLSHLHVLRKINNLVVVTLNAQRLKNLYSQSYTSCTAHASLKHVHSKVHVSEESVVKEREGDISLVPTVSPSSPSLGGGLHSTFV